MFLLCSIKNAIAHILASPEQRLLNNAHVWGKENIPENVPSRKFQEPLETSGLVNRPLLYRCKTEQHQRGVENIPEDGEGVSKTNIPRPLFFHPPMSEPGKKSNKSSSLGFPSTCACPILKRAFPLI